MSLLLVSYQIIPAAFGEDFARKYTSTGVRHGLQSSSWRSPVPSSSAVPGRARHEIQLFCAGMRLTIRQIAHEKHCLHECMRVRGNPDSRTSSSTG